MGLTRETPRQSCESYRNQRTHLDVTFASSLQTRNRPQKMHARPRRTDSDTNTHTTHIAHADWESSMYRTPGGKVGNGASKPTVPLPEPRSWPTSRGAYA